ncbi:MAG: DNA translocase FtsK [Anaerolineales bacterium]
MPSTTKKPKPKNTPTRKPQTSAPKTKAPPKPKTQAKPARKPTAPRRPLRSLSLDRKLDLLGVVLALTGILSLLSFLSGNRSNLTGAWVNFLQNAFGWGAFVFPLSLIAIGVWLILRNFERIPQVGLERLTGALLLYLNLLAGLHFIIFPESREASFAVAQTGNGGGYVGAALLELLLRAIGWWGAAIVLVAWLVISLMLLFDTSVPELFQFIPPALANLRVRWQTLKLPMPPPDAPPAPENDLPHGFTPLPLAKRAGALGNAAPPSSNAASPQAPAPVTPQPTAAPWRLPVVAELLNTAPQDIHNETLEKERVHIIETTLASFGAPARVVEVNRGPTITQYGVEPDFIETRQGRTRVRVGKIAALSDDLALALAARRIRIQAPVPGRGYVGIEVPNERPNAVTLRDTIESEAFQRLTAPLRFAVGQDVAGNAVAANLAAMPHLLIAGATGSGKSVCVNAIITCLLLHNTPDQLRLIMVDPKRVELTGYNGIPHLLSPVVVDLERVVGALQWVTREMDLRYQKFSQTGARNLNDYNQRMLARNERTLPHLVVIIDELADLMMLSPDETERSITRLAQLARATGIHLIIATQRPSVDVVTGLIKANFPARIAFAVSSGVDSRVILDQPGAERLLGSGDMLFQAPDAPAPVRLQGAYVSDAEISGVVNFWREQSGLMNTAAPLVDAPVGGLPSGIPLKQLDMLDDLGVEPEGDPLYHEAIALVRQHGRASVSMLQRKMRIGYTRASRLIEQMESNGIVGPPEGSTGAREVLDYGPAAPPMED